MFHVDVPPRIGRRAEERLASALHEEARTALGEIEPVEHVVVAAVDADVAVAVAVVRQQHAGADPARDHVQLAAHQIARALAVVSDRNVVRDDRVVLDFQDAGVVVRAGRVITNLQFRRYPAAWTAEKTRIVLHRQHGGRGERIDAGERVCRAPRCVGDVHGHVVLKDDLADARLADAPQHVRVRPRQVEAAARGVRQHARSRDRAVHPQAGVAGLHPRRIEAQVQFRPLDFNRPFHVGLFEAVRRRQILVVDHDA